MSVPLLDLGPEYHRQLSLDTREGNPIPNAQRIEMDPSRRKAVIRTINKQCPKARPRSITQVYNCLGLAFASRRTCIDVDAISMVLREDDYCRVPRLKDTKPGDLVIYRDDPTGECKHIGMILGELPLLERSKKTEFWVISQFGWDGEWIHPIDQVPDDCKGTIEYWTDRKWENDDSEVV